MILEKRKNEEYWREVTATCYESFTVGTSPLSVAQARVIHVTIQTWSTVLAELANAKICNCK